MKVAVGYTQEKVWLRKLKVGKWILFVGAIKLKRKGEWKFSPKEG